MSKLDDWELEAKEDCERVRDIVAYAYGRNHRILKLIELIRKMEEALKKIEELE